MKITNTQPGPRGVNTVNGPVLVDPKHTVEVDVFAREQAHIEAAGWFTIEGDYTPNPGAAVAPPMNSDATSTEIAGLKAEITTLKGDLKARDTEIAGLKKQIGGNQPSERDALKARATELKLEFAGNISTDKLKELVAHAEKLEAMSDTELKTFLGTKGVEVKDETRDDLIKLALAA